VAIDRTSKLASAELHEKATRRVAGNFLGALAAAVPYQIHPVLPDDGTHSTEPSGNAGTPEAIKAMRAEKVLSRCHSFQAACADLDIEHRLTKPRHPWTNGQVERMNRTIKDATVKRFHDDSHDRLRQHLADFVAAYAFARRLKTLPAWPHPLRGHLQSLGRRTRQVHPGSAPPNAGTKQLARFTRRIGQEPGDGSPRSAPG
jgi:hypothetical protein